MLLEFKQMTLFFLLNIGILFYIGNLALFRPYSRSNIALTMSKDRKPERFSWVFWSPFQEIVIILLFSMNTRVPKKIALPTEHFSQNSLFKVEFPHYIATGVNFWKIKSESWKLIF